MSIYAKFYRKHENILEKNPTKAAGKRIIIYKMKLSTRTKPKIRQYEKRIHQNAERKNPGDKRIRKGNSYRKRLAADRGKDKWVGERKRDERCAHTILFLF